MPALARLPLPTKAAIFLACLGVISWLSLSPTNRLPKVSLSDKLEHSIAYALLAVVAAALFPNRIGRLVAVCMAFGIFIEVLQATMGFGRQGDWRDAVANASGAFIVVLVVALIRRVRRAQ